jgi:outer membrane protein OmpA-like peptidoglycan-associated protein
MASRATRPKRPGSGRARPTSRVAPRRMPYGSRGRARGRPRPPHRPSYRRRSYRRPTQRSWLLGLLAAGLAATAGLGLVGFMVARAHAPDCASAGDTIIFADQVTQEEGSNPHPPPGLMGEAGRLASCGGGQLVLIRGAGQGGVQAGPAISLRIYREAGEIENDPTARANKVRQLITHAFETSETIRPPGAGRDVVGLIATISSELGRRHNDVWLRTFGLPTVNPANARVLMAADPAQAAASIAGPLPRLHGARVHLVLSPAAGDQPRLNPASDAWRRTFMVALLRRMGADVVSVTEEETIEAPAPGTPPAPVVANLPDPTQRPPAPHQPHRPYTTKLDSSTWFLPDSARFTVSKSRILAELQPIISGWRRGLYSRVNVTGHCARYGPAATAVLLSKQRAAAVARLLQLHGVSDVTSTGVGYSQPLPPDPTSASNRVVVITAYPKN